MRGANVFLLVIALVFVGAIGYYNFLTDISVEASARRGGGDILLTLDISNGGILRAEWFSFSAQSPASVASCDFEGGDIGALSSATVSVNISGAEDECRLDIEYYVLGTRRVASVVVN